MGPTKSSISCQLPASPPAPVNSLNCFTTACFFRGNRKNSPYLAESCLHMNAAQYSFVRVFATCKSNIKANKNVTAHHNHIKTADWSKLQTLMNMSVFAKNYFRLEFSIFRTDSLYTKWLIFRHSYSCKGLKQCIWFHFKTN